jgi:hypothetical protein
MTTDMTKLIVAFGNFANAYKNSRQNSIFSLGTRVLLVVTARAAPGYDKQSATLALL